LTWETPRLHQGFRIVGKRSNSYITRTPFRATPSSVSCFSVKKHTTARAFLKVPLSKSFFAMPELRDCRLVSDAGTNPAMELYVGSDSLPSIDSKRRRIVQGSKISTGRRYATIKFCELKMSFVSKISSSSASRALFSCYLLLFKFIELFPLSSR